MCLTSMIIVAIIRVAANIFFIWLTGPIKKSVLAKIKNKQTKQVQTVK